MTAARRCFALVIAATAMAGLVASCGSFSDATDAPVGDEGGLVAETGSDGSDAGGADGTSVRDAMPPDAPLEAGPTARKCPVGAPFGSVQSITLARSDSIESARFSPDQSTGYFSLCGMLGSPTDCTIYSATKDNGLGTFGVFMQVLANPDGAYDAFATISSDGMHMLFDSTRGGGQTSLFSGALMSGAVTAAVVKLPLPSNPAGVTAASHPYLLANGPLYFAAIANSDFELYRATGGSAAEIIAAKHLVATSSSMTDFAPVVSEDELEIFWASDRAAAMTKGGLDVWSASRAPTAATGEFTGTALVPALSSSSNDHPVWLSPDACDIYLVRKDANGTGTLFVAHR